MSDKSVEKPLKELTLYTFWQASSAWRVRIVLSLKGVLKEKTQLLPVHLLRDGGEQFKAEFVRINPMSQVPALGLNNNATVLTQSVAIMEFLNETYPVPPLLPSESLKRAGVRQIVQLISSGIQPYHNHTVLDKLIAAEKDRVPFVRWAIERGFQALEKMLQTCSGRFCFGDDLSLADACLVPQVACARRYEVDVSQFPIIEAINARLVALPAFIEAGPDSQPDAPL